MNTTENRYIKNYFLILALAMMIIPAVTLNLKKNVQSALDNRTLAEFPQYNVFDDNFIEGINDYVEDRIGFREQALAAYQIMNNRFFHYLVHPLYEYGRDEWIMTKNWDPIQTYHLDLEIEFPGSFASFMKQAQGIANENGADFMFLLIPNKETVYPEHLSVGYDIKEQRTKSDLIMDALDKESVPYLYLLPKFQELKGTVQLYNVKDDPGHWNANGYFYGNVEMINYLRDHYDTNIKPMKIDQFNVENETTEYLYQSRIKIDEVTPRYSLKNPTFSIPKMPFWETAEGSNTIEYKVRPDLFENEYERDKPRILIIHDSYFEIEEFFIGNQFSSVCLVHSSEIKNYRRTIELFKPDIVVIESTERVIGPEQNFYNDVVIKYQL